jgi:hypothetical protein
MLKGSCSLEKGHAGTLPPFRTLCGLLSKREESSMNAARVSPFAGMHGSVGAWGVVNVECGMCSQAKSIITLL